MTSIIGTVLDKRYEIIEIVGSGGMATVYRAKDLILNRMVAVKILKRELSNDEDFVMKFEKESQSAASLSHPNIVNIFDVGLDQGMHYIIMELVTGNTLRDYLNKMNGFMKEEAVINITLQIASALNNAHQNNIIHRDIKSQNILVNEQGSIKVADFGIARATTKSTIVNTKEVVGSVHYTSPEQARGGYVDERSDIYSLGILMYELTTKELPYVADTPVAVALKHLKDELPDLRLVNDQISEGLVSIIHKATQKDLNMRYQSVSEMIEDLKHVRNDKHYVVEEHIYLNDETMVLPKITEEDIMNHQLKKQNQNHSAKGKMPKNSSEDEQKNMKRKKGGKKAPVNKLNATLVVLAALLLSLLVFSVFAINKIQDMFKTEIVLMPYVTGLPSEEAIRILNEKGLIADTTEKRFDNTVEQGHVISQSLPEGEELKEGYTINLVISNGPVLVTTPNVLHQTLQKATVMIENVGLTIGEPTYEFDDLPAGMIIQQTPKAGVKVKEGETVEIVISQGVKITTVLIPNLAGNTLAEAEKALKDLGLKVGKVEELSSEDVEKGLVISNAGVGSEAKQGASVNLSISTGPDSTDPQVDPTTGAELTSRLFVIPTDTFINDPEAIKVEMVQGEVTTVVYEKTHAKDEKEVKFTIKGTGSAVINIYFSGQLVSTQYVEF
ncbi:Stk1 family PASTA domain-containing Ser/Thr kinase [Fusibacter ferrireducens]|uniref:non-specific serine/threonine protein kinase n=1 Tax=Fusibacter ferrireducens TaxID=2785058 RepID=A0ABR9ZMI7_9FIRM|nr:Stk1 family PASTA domain-containing Ser/Thr kinase [Fusibacter ferrireducens]MBF4691675.1 Stk1 family PASTA domain-containing Ser/Thr kinase [Fusibacter ferrireducens]